MSLLRHYCMHVPAQAISDVLAVSGLSRRSSQWPRVRKVWLLDHPSCAGCGSLYCIQVHHRKPFHLHPELELDIHNFITLCEQKSLHHFNLGHNGTSWKDFNPHVERDAAVMRSHPKMMAEYSGPWWMRWWHELTRER